MKNLDAILKAIKNNLDPIKIIIFGSFAKGKTHPESDLDIAVIQSTSPKLGQKADIFLSLAKMGYNWKVEPDIHIFSEKEFEDKLKQRDLFISEISKGKVVYV